MWFTVHFSDYIVTLTERDRQNYMSIAHRRKGIATIDNPINFLQKSVLVKEKIIFTVGQLFYRKGFVLLAQIFP